MAAASHCKLPDSLVWHETPSQALKDDSNEFGTLWPVPDLTCMHIGEKSNPLSGPSEFLEMGRWNAATLHGHDSLVRGSLPA